MSCTPDRDSLRRVYFCRLSDTICEELRTDQQSQRPRSEVCKVKAHLDVLSLELCHPRLGLLSLKFGHEWREMDIKNSYYNLEFRDSQAPTLKVKALSGY